MALSKTPQLTGPRALMALAVLVSLAIAALLPAFAHNVAGNLGDTDDALRLVQVRDLLAGRGWYDQSVIRFQPYPLWTHWSRLLDGSIAGFDWLLQRGLPPATAEVATRFFWPLLWVLPATLAALSAARSLARSAGLLAMAVLLVANFTAYSQFLPGRIDHHNVQITLAMGAFAFALLRSPPVVAAILCAATTVLGLAIGLEALPFHALIGASFGLRALIERESRRAAIAYGLTLAGLAPIVFGVQTPPWRWSLSVCDALGLNTVVGLSLSGLAVAAAAALPARYGPVVRTGVLLAAAAVAGGAYLAMDPACLHGPLGAVDPRVKPFWFDRISELETWPTVFKHRRFEALLCAATAIGALVSATALLLRGRDIPLTSRILSLALVVVAVVGAWQVYRAQDYLLWFGLVLVAVGLGRLAVRLGNQLLVVLATAAVLSPANAATLANGGLTTPSATATSSGKSNACAEVGQFRRLATLPPGLVMAEIDLGPHILADTPHRAVVGPYHRMTDALLLDHAALDGDTADTLPLMQAAGVTYVVDCRGFTYPLSPHGLLTALRQGRTPPWLQPLSPPGEALQIYRVAPPAPQPKG